MSATTERSGLSQEQAERGGQSQPHNGIVGISRVTFYADFKSSYFDFKRLSLEITYQIYFQPSRFQDM